MGLFSVDGLTSRTTLVPQILRQSSIVASSSNSKNNAHVGNIARYLTIPLRPGTSSNKPEDFAPDMRSVSAH